MAVFCWGALFVAVFGFVFIEKFLDLVEVFLTDEGLVFAFG